MKKITNKQARIIAKELNKFIIKHIAPWDIDEKPTIKGTMDDIRNDPKSIDKWLCGYLMFNFDNDELRRDADKILDMLRRPDEIETTMALYGSEVTA